MVFGLALAVYFYYQLMSAKLILTASILADILNFYRVLFFLFTSVPFFSTSKLKKTIFFSNLIFRPFVFYHEIGIKKKRNQPHVSLGEITLKPHILL